MEVKGSVGGRSSGGPGGRIYPPQMLKELGPSHWVGKGGPGLFEMCLSRSSRQFSTHPPTLIWQVFTEHELTTYDILRRTRLGSETAMQHPETIQHPVWAAERSRQQNKHTKGVQSARHDTTGRDQGVTTS